MTIHSIVFTQKSVFPKSHCFYPKFSSIDSGNKSEGESDISLLSSLFTLNEGKQQNF